MKKSRIKTLISILVIVIIFYFLNNSGYLDAILEIKKTIILSLLALALLSFFISGFQMGFMLKEQEKISITTTDKLLLPISMSLFGYIIPTNGSMIYSIYFLKKKYNIDSSKGLSIGLASVYVSFIVSGIFGIILCFFYENEENGLILTISSCLIFSPKITAIVNKMQMKIVFKDGGYLKKIQEFINSSVLSSTNLMSNHKILIANFIFTGLYIIITFISFSLLNEALSIGLEISTIFLILIITRVSSLIRILPGNLGVEEVYMAGIFKIIGQAIEKGVVFSILGRAIALIIIIPFGIAHFMINLKHVSFKELKKNRNK
ncbi:flippase-like domain-containing protein [Flavobacteriales bacterium]|nr:flippase-like domain-containing protein [Flavobacteriales bacterium]|tara:strand:+ start:1780 stop:2736 length:957 start_codon:yes stop_codon:yes gene_type:complete